MGVRLEKLIEERAKHIVKQYESNDEYSKEDLQETIDALSAKWRSEVKQEVMQECTDEEITRMKKTVDEAREAYSTKKAIEDLRVLVVEGIFLAIAVGLLVNQVTDLITYAKSEKDYSFTLLAIAILCFILFGYVLTRLASTISKLLKK